LSACELGVWAGSGAHNHRSSSWPSCSAALQA
jgi:hypothetical protein